MEKLKNKKVGRKPYIADTKLLKDLYIKIANKEITNEQGWKIARLQKNIMVQDEKRTGGKK